MVLKFFIKYEKSIYTFACSLLLIFCLIKIIFSVNAQYRFIVYPYQLEYREGAGLVTVRDFMQNENPFSLNLQPQHTYTYGFLNPYLISLTAKIFGNTLFVHRVFTYFFLSAACLIIFFVLLRIKVNFALAFSAMFILHQSFINALNTTVARPEGLGIFFMTLAIIIPWRWNYSVKSLLLSVLFGILGFLTKQYYLISIPAMTAYLFIFINREKAVKYFLISISALISVVLMLDIIFPVYLNNTFFMHLNIASYDFSYMINQLVIYTETNLYLILIIFLSLLFSINKMLKGKLVKSGDEFTSKTKIYFRLNTVTKLFSKSPLVDSNFDFLFLFTFVFILFVFIFNLGGHKGNSDAVYLFQLASPFLVLLTFQLLNFTKSKLFLSFTSLLLIFTLNTEFNVQNHDYAKFESIYNDVEEIIKTSSNPLNSPENVSIMINENKPVYNSGLSEFFGLGKNTFVDSKDKSDFIYRRITDFRIDVNDKIRNKQFDVIMLTEGYYSFFVDQMLLNEKYSLVKKIDSYMIYQEWKTEVWKPK